MTSDKHAYKHPTARTILVFEAAAMLKKKEAYIRNLCHKGILKAYQFDKGHEWIIDRESVILYAKQHGIEIS